MVGIEDERQEERQIVIGQGAESVARDPEG